MANSPAGRRDRLDMSSTEYPASRSGRSRSHKCCRHSARSKTQTCPAHSWRTPRLPRRCTRWSKTALLSTSGTGRKQPSRCPSGMSLWRKSCTPSPPRRSGTGLGCIGCMHLPGRSPGTSLLSTDCTRPGQSGSGTRLLMRSMDHTGFHPSTGKKFRPRTPGIESNQRLECTCPDRIARIFRCPSCS
jgi:hypothetical protein